MNKQTHTLRYLGIVTLFCLVCVIYLGRLFFIQISGRENQYSADITEREVTVQAVRGEIYDRNGVKLVANRYSYDLSFAHQQFFAWAYRPHLPNAEARESENKNSSRLTVPIPITPTVPIRWTVTRSVTIVSSACSVISGSRSTPPP